MTLLDVELIGSQEPTTLLLPDGDDSTEADEALEWCDVAGMTLDPWQRTLLRRSLMRDGPRWAAREVGLIVCRQVGKGRVLEARQMLGLFFFGERLGIHTAHEFKTCYEHFRRCVDFVEASDDLRKRVKIIRTGAGDQAIELLNGCRLRFIARSRSSGRGFSGDAVYLDEAFKLDDDTFGALLPTLSARPDPQLWLTSSAPHSDSSVLHRVRERGHRGDEHRLLFCEWGNEPGTDPTDVDAWVRGIPGLGIRIHPEDVAVEQRSMSPEEFARERLGIPDLPDGARGMLDVAAWSALCDPAEAPRDVRIALEVAPDRSWASFGAAGRRADQLIHVELVDRFVGTAGVVARAAQLHQTYQTPIIVDPASPAGSLIPQLVADGVEVDEFTTRDLTQACGAFVDAITNDEIRHIGQRELDAAVAAARERKVGEAWAFARVSGQVDVTPLLAVAAAVGRVPAKRKPKLYVSVD